MPRLRMFAGPNGSGKSTIKDKLPSQLLGFYINPDEIEQRIEKHRKIDFNEFGVNISKLEIMAFFSESILLQRSGLVTEIKFLEFIDNVILFHQVSMNSYFASVCADLIRNKLLDAKLSFTFETVMSSMDKIEILKNYRKLCASPVK